jgi:putative redox protein
MADKHVFLRWTGEGERFEGGVRGGPVTTIDGEGKAAPGPMDTLALTLAGCMGIDILMILQKGRVPVDGLEVVIEGDRAPEPPRRYTRLLMTVRLTGPGEEHDARIQRAVDLSRDKYCSVFHTLRSDLDVEIAVERN